jgi:hypothetical protein
MSGGPDPSNPARWSGTGQRQVGGEEAAQLGDRLLEPAGPRAERLPRDARGVELPLHVPGTQPELQAAVAQDVERRGLTGQQRGIPEGGVQHEGADPQVLGGVGRGLQHRERGRRAEMVGDEDGVEAGALRAAAPLLQRFP